VASRNDDNGVIQKRMGRFANREGMPDGAGDRPGIEGLFWSHEGPVIHKWHHYLPVYERYFAPRWCRLFMFLETGVSAGGPMSLWWRYFGSEAVIFGDDIDPNCAAMNGLDRQVWIGSQDDPKFLEDVVWEMDGIDIVLNDGSHVSKNIRAFLNVLFPLLKDGGLYAIDDLHATYWSTHEGGDQKPDSCTGDIRQMYNYMHHWYHTEGQKIETTSDSLAALHLYESVAVLKRRRGPPPRHVKFEARRKVGDPSGDPLFLGLPRTPSQRKYLPKSSPRQTL